jgi:hypothetical protein
MLPAVGLELLGSEVDVGVTFPGEVEYTWERTNITAAGPKLVAAGLADEALLTLADGYFGQPGTVITGFGIVAAWGRKPR